MFPLEPKLVHIQIYFLHALLLFIHTLRPQVLSYLTTLPVCSSPVYRQFLLLPASAHADLSSEPDLCFSLLSILKMPIHPLRQPENFLPSNPSFYQEKVALSLCIPMA